MALISLTTYFSLQKTPLHYAAAEGHSDIVDKLVTNKAQVDCKDREEVRCLFQYFHDLMHDYNLYICKGSEKLVVHGRINPRAPGVFASCHQLYLFVTLQVKLVSSISKMPATNRLCGNGGKEGMKALNSLLSGTIFACLLQENITNETMQAQIALSLHRQSCT